MLFFLQKKTTMRSNTLGDYFSDKKYCLEESDYLNDKLPDKISS